VSSASWIAFLSGPHADHRISSGTIRPLLMDIRAILMRCKRMNLIVAMSVTGLQPAIIYVA